MAFKVVIKHPSEEGDEHTYYGMVFLKDGISKLKRLEYSNTEENFQAEFVFDGNPVEPNENYMGVLFPVNEVKQLGTHYSKFNTTIQHLLSKLLNFHDSVMHNSTTERG